jgi:hypothetical protein
MRMNSQIPFMGVVPDYVNALAMGQGAAMQRNEGARQNALAQLYQAQGPGIIAGEQGAVNALAAIDPGAALGVMDTRQGMDARSLGMDATRQNMDLQMREWAASMDDRERAQRLQEGQQMMAQFIRADTPEAWSALMVQLGKPDVPFEQRGQMINNMREPMDLLAMYDAQNAPRDTTFIVSGENEYGLDPRGQYNVTVSPGGGVQATPIGSIPGDPSPSASEAQIARIMRTVNPNTGDFYTEQEAINIVDLQGVVIDPFRNVPMVYNRGSGAVINPQVSPQPVADTAVTPPATTAVAPPPNAPPPPSFDITQPNARAAFGIPGMSANLANTVTDTLGLGQAFPEAGEQIAQFAVLGEMLLNDIVGGYSRQPPSWLLQQIDALIPRAGRAFTGPDQALQQFESLYAVMSAERDREKAAAENSPSPELRAQAQQNYGALDGALMRIEDAIAKLRPGNNSTPQGTTTGGVTWRIIE